MPADDLTKALGALAMIGLGYAAYTAMDASARRRCFENALRSGLAPHGIGLIDATIARAVGGRRLWRITVNLPRAGLAREEFEVEAGTSETEAAVLNGILS